MKWIDWNPFIIFGIPTFIMNINTRRRT